MARQRFSVVGTLGQRQVRQLPNGMVSMALDVETDDGVYAMTAPYADELLAIPPDLLLQVDAEWQKGWLTGETTWLRAAYDYETGSCLYRSVLHTAGR